MLSSRINPPLPLLTRNTIPLHKLHNRLPLPTLMLHPPPINRKPPPIALRPRPLVRQIPIAHQTLPDVIETMIHMVLLRPQQGGIYLVGLERRFGDGGVQRPEVGADVDEAVELVKQSGVVGEGGGVVADSGGDFGGGVGFCG